ncbi:ABC transporter ATP-binding protein [Rickettsia endosymbiont of Cantharis rufa]|uniref:ATP-binding cassette domain-containing protein n=1 Tax=Rickettsia endosymbiont of Cantharis rufa TaxID=3066248 RepID=UPI003132B89D
MHQVVVKREKIGTIKAIISNPKILILDEVFANLDKTSIENAQQALKEFLPETLMLVVYHDGKSHDYNNSYDHFIKSIQNLGFNYENFLRFLYRLQGFF